MTVVSLVDVTPPPRYDGTPWTTGEMQEAPSSDPAANWVTLLTVALVPADTDPEAPQPRDFTASNAALVAGWYRVIFSDAAGGTVTTAPVQNVPPIGFEPSLQQVGAIALSRTVDDVGRITGTFTEQTRPTDDNVYKLLAKAIEDVTPQIGTDIPADLIDKAKNLVALRTAMLIELTMFGQEIRSNISPYPEYKKLYDEELLQLKDEIAAEEAGGDPTDQLGGNYPSFGFPGPDDLLTRKM